LVLIPAAEAQIVSPFHLVPVVAKVSGAAGTDWMTSLWVSNTSDVTVNVEATFYRENQNNTPFAGPTRNFSLSAGQTLTVPDVLGNWFPGQGNTKGFLMLLAEPASGDGDALLAVNARVFNNANPGATYGQTVSSGLFSMIFGRGVAVLPGAQWDGGKRSNVGVVNLGGQPLDLIITVYSASGAPLATARRTVETFSLRQWSLQQLGVSNLGTPGRVEVMVDPDTITWDPCNLMFGGPGGFGSLITYMSRVDGVTGDAEFGLGQNDWTMFEVDCGYDPEDDCPPAAALMP
jgi:hypothetical protein